MNIITRDGSVMEFNPNRIFNAISKAFNACGYSMSNEVIQKIVDDVPIWDNIHIEEIQDQVEEILSDWGYNDVAVEYKLYRRDRALIRQQKNELMKQISEKLNATNIVNQNANVDEESFGGKIGEATRVVTKNDALNNKMSNMAKCNHENNEIYIHDLDSYSVGEHNCLSIPFDDLLAKGFTAKQGDVRPAASINTAFQLIAVIFQIQSLQQFGGVSATHLDWTMVPYVRKSFYKHWCDGNKYIMHNEEVNCFNLNTPIQDYPVNDVYKYAYDMTERELEQAVEGMYHNLNTLQSRSGN